VEVPWERYSTDSTYDHFPNEQAVDGANCKDKKAIVLNDEILIVPGQENFLVRQIKQKSYLRQSQGSIL